MKTTVSVPPTAEVLRDLLRDLAREQETLTRVVASLRERLDMLAGASDVATVYGLLERRVAELAERLQTLEAVVAGAVILGGEHNPLERRVAELERQAREPIGRPL